MVADVDSRFTLRPEVQRVECQCSAADGRIDHIGDHGRSGRHLAGAEPMEEDFTYRIAGDTDRVIRFTYFRQRTSHLYQCRCYTQFQYTVGQLGDSQ